MFEANCQPTTVRLETSIKKLKNTMPSQQPKYVKSAIRTRLGASAAKSPVDQIRPARRAGVSDTPTGRFT